MYNMNIWDIYIYVINIRLDLINTLQKFKSFSLTTLVFLILQLHIHLQS